jgi:hypothetical protein
MTRARVLTFHVDDDELFGLTEAIDAVTEEFASLPDFRGLLCLERDGARDEVIVVTLWDGDGLDATEAVSEAGRRRIAATTDLGVCSKRYEVLRLVSGLTMLETVVEPLAS